MPKLAGIVSKNIRSRRSALGMTQETLCKKTGMSLRYLSLLENSPQNLSLVKIELLAAALQTSPSDLMSDSNSAPKILQNPVQASHNELVEQAFELLGRALGRKTR